MSDESYDWVEVGCVTRPHGVRGELRVKLHNPESEILFDVDEVFVRQEDGSERLMAIRSARPAADGIVLLVFNAVTDRSGADAMRGATLHVSRRALPPTHEDEFYVHDILGARVVDEDGTVFGEVIDYVSYPAVAVLVVQGEKRYEVPLIDDFVRRIDTDAKQIVVGPIGDFETS